MPEYLLVDGGSDPKEVPDSQLLAFIQGLERVKELVRVARELASAKESTLQVFVSRILPETQLHCLLTVGYRMWS